MGVPHHLIWTLVTGYVSRHRDRPSIWCTQSLASPPKSCPTSIVERVDEFTPYTRRTRLLRHDTFTSGIRCHERPRRFVKHGSLVICQIPQWKTSLLTGNCVSPPSSFHFFLNKPYVIETIYKYDGNSENYQSPLFSRRYRCPSREPYCHTQSGPPFEGSRRLQYHYCPG